VNGARAQRGLILASGLLLMATGMLTMSTVMGIAVRELSRTQVIESLEQAREAAAMGLSVGLRGFEPLDTLEAELASAVLADGSRWRVSSSFLGVVPRPLEPSLMDWHFLLDSMATSPAGAEIRERLQIRLAAPPPPDLAACLDGGCPVPPLCGPPDPDCPLEIRARPQPVAWHLPEDQS
jgi:hypothetical protein